MPKIVPTLISEVKVTTQVLKISQFDDSIESINDDSVVILTIIISQSDHHRTDNQSFLLKKLVLPDHSDFQSL